MSDELIKEKAKSRMLRNAARLWAAEEVDIEVSFDPIVTMLIEGCVNEIGKIGNEIHNTHARVISRLAHLLTPEALTGYLPAHAVMHAKPNERNSVIQTQSQFYFTKKIPSPANPMVEVSKEIFFSPVSPVKLTDGAIKYIAFKNWLYETVNAYQKTMLAEGVQGKQLSGSSLWLGIELNIHVDDLDGMNFYFDLKNNPGKNSFLNLLPITKWYVNDHLIKTKPGFESVETGDKSSLEDEFSLDKKIEVDVKALYNRYFISVDGVTKTTIDIAKERKLHPEDFDGIFSTKDLQKLKENILWVRVEFPYSVSENLLTDLTCAINCFPIVNKRYNEFSFRLSQNLNIIPLNTSDYFISMRGVYASDGFAYTDNLLSGSQGNNGGTYTLRQGGIERFDSRNAQEMLDYLLDLLRDESAAFSALGNEFISSNLKQLNQTLALLDQQLSKQQNQKEPTSYLVVDPHKDTDNIFVSFWTTNGDLSNDIKAGNKLMQFGVGDVQAPSLLLLTTTTGGRNKLNDTERLSAFKQTLISRGRIVTVQDIRLFCLHELGNAIEDVKVKKGCITSNNVLSGFTQTIDVILTVSKSNRATPDEWRDLCDNLAVKLMQRSSGLTPIEVFTTEAYMQIR